MTSTHGKASIGPQADGAATFSRARRRRRGGVRRRFARRELLALPAALVLLVPAASAIAQTSSTGTSGYGTKPPTPTTKTEPKKEVEHSKEKTATTPKAAPEPVKEVATTPTPTPTTPKAATLPFTGLNLTWVLGGGLLLLAAGLSIRLALRTRAGG
ncbi:MAG TPA: hypothetical protein VNV42_03880 [Solirubrobacteraceae bacterium]|jgi:hypothetical protein|nr:hypothetical protein [Solirubrobacteraceae bacterium]